MFARASTALSLISLVSSAVATAETVTITVTATAPGTTEPASSCTTGPVHCCQQLQKASDPVPSKLLGLLGVVVEGVDPLVGLICSPITLIGVGTGDECMATSVCCEDNSYDGLILIGCVPVVL